MDYSHELTADEISYLKLLPDTRMIKNGFVYYFFRPAVEAPGYVNREPAY